MIRASTSRQSNVAVQRERLNVQGNAAQRSPLFFRPLGERTRGQKKPVVLMREQRAKSASARDDRVVRHRRRHRATEVRQGEIILKTPLRRAIFLGGLAALALLPFVFWLLSR